MIFFPESLNKQNYIKATLNGTMKKNLRLSNFIKWNVQEEIFILFSQKCGSNECE
jgi:hypothetical protein